MSSFISPSSGNDIQDDSRPLATAGSSRVSEEMSCSLSLDVSSSQTYGSLDSLISTGDINCEHVSCKQNILLWLLDATLALCVHLKDIRKCDDFLAVLDQSLDGLSSTDASNEGNGFQVGSSKDVEMSSFISPSSGNDIQDDSRPLATAGSSRVSEEMSCGPCPIDDSNSGHVPHFDDNLQSDTAPYQSQLECANYVIRRPEISPSHAPCRGGKSLVAYNVQLIYDEEYLLLFVGRKGRPCVTAHVATEEACLFLRAISPRYESPERVKVYVMTANNDIVNADSPIEFEFMDDELSQLLEKCEATTDMDEVLSLFDEYVHSSVTTVASQLKGNFTGKASDISTLCLAVSQKLSKYLRGQGTPLTSNSIDELWSYIHVVGLTKVTLLQLAKILGISVRKLFKALEVGQEDELNEEEMATSGQMHELLSIASTTGSCVEEVITCVKELQEFSYRIDYIDEPYCDVDVLHGFEELSAGMKAWQCKDRSPSSTEPCDSLFEVEKVMGVFHRVKELTVGIKARQCEDRPPSTKPCDFLFEVENSLEDILRKEYLGDRDDWVVTTSSEFYGDKNFLGMSSSGVPPDVPPEISWPSRTKILHQLFSKMHLVQLKFSSDNAQSESSYHIRDCTDTI
jgi:hypothetical protein